MGGSSIPADSAALYSSYVLDYGWKRAEEATFFRRKAAADRQFEAINFSHDQCEEEC
jgi:hypothetical protein